MVLDKSEFERYKHIAEVNIANSPDYFSCAGCGSVLRKGTFQCEECGYKPEYTCPKCHSDLNYGQELCKSCGTRINW